MAVPAQLAGAPISWGVCEVPGWGLQLPPARVLNEMAELRLQATELGPIGYLGASADAVRARLSDFGLALVGGFAPVVLHDPAVRKQTLRSARKTAALLAGAGAGLFITAVVVDAGWSPRIELDKEGWHHLFSGLADLDALCADHGLTQVLHPHVGTLVETADDIARVLAGSDVRFCLDTGHLAIGGVDPVAFARDHHDRVAHVHLKDVRMPVAARLRAGELNLVEATRLGLFCPLGQGDVAIAEVVDLLLGAGYHRWYVLEQDTAITDGEPPAACKIDVRASLDFLGRLGANILVGGPNR